MKYKSYFVKPDWVPYGQTHTKTNISGHIKYYDIFTCSNCGNQVRGKITTQQEVSVGPSASVAFIDLPISPPNDNPKNIPDGWEVYYVDSIVYKCPECNWDEDLYVMITS